MSVGTGRQVLLGVLDCVSYFVGTNEFDELLRAKIELQSARRSRTGKSKAHRLNGRVYTDRQIGRQTDSTETPLRPTEQDGE